MQPVADKPADGDIDGRLAHQLAVVDDADQQPGKHQSHGDLGIDPRSPLFMAIALDDLRPQPSQVENAIDADQHMIVRNELPQ